MLIVILSFVGAQINCQSQQNNNPPAADPQQIFNADIKPKIDAFFNKPGFPSSVAQEKRSEVEDAGLELASELANLMNANPPKNTEANDIKSKVSQYFSGVNTKVDDMFAMVNAFSPAPAAANAKTAAENYFEDGSGFTSEFFRDMKSQNNNFDVDSYLSDFTILKSQAENFLKIAGANAQVGSGAQVVFDIKKFLDSGLISPANKKVTLEIIGDGLVTHRFQNEVVFNILQKFRNTPLFSNDIDFARNLDFFLNTFNLVQSIQVANNPGPEVFNKRINALETFSLNAFGNVTPDVDPASTNAPLVAVQIPTHGDSETNGAFNARSHSGLPYGQDVPFPQLRLTVNNRKFEIDDLAFTSPIVFDMDGDSKLQACGGNWLPHEFNQNAAFIKEFDLDGDGFNEFVEWVGPNDGLLVAYNPNTDMSGLQLFGEPGGFFDGYHKLSIYDVNNDRVLTGEELKDLSIWQDKNSNAKVDAGEIQSLADLKITSIAVTHKDFESTFTQDGQVRKAWDYYPCLFSVKRTK